MKEYKEKPAKNRNDIMKRKYNYAIIKENYPELQRESTLGENLYDPKKKYALIVKDVHSDGSESILFIHYDNYLHKLHKQAKYYPSWYNYPIGISQDMQGCLREL